MNGKALAIVIVFVTNIRLCQGRRYDNYSLYSLVPLEKEHLKFLQNLESQNYIDLTFWRRPSKLYQTVQLIVAPKDAEMFKERCKHYGIKMEEINNNVQQLFNEQNNVQRYMRFQTDTFSWNQYHTLQDINHWLADIVNKYPTICELLQVGKSIENRDIYALSIVKKKIKGTVVVEAGIHGNEWISSEFVTFLAQDLLNSSRIDYRLKEVLEYRWLLIPVVNPDGYEYSQKSDRMWRKNRRYYDNATYGVDLNRNFDYSFNKFGSSNNTSSDVYCGPLPFSEPETSALSKFISENASNLKYYFSVHAYGQTIIIPYGDKILHVDNYGECENYGKQALYKIYKKYGLKYGIGNSYDTLGHKISGNSASWVKNTFHVPYVYTFLLRDNGVYGYGLPPSEIVPACEEALTAMLEIMTTHTKRLRADIFSDSAVGDGASCRLLLAVITFWLAK